MTPATRHGIAASRLFVCVVTPAWLADPQCSTALAYAIRLGKPIRLLLAPGLRLPEDAFAGIANLEVARSQDPATDAAQIKAWLAALSS